MAYKNIDEFNQEIVSAAVPFNLPDRIEKYNSASTSNISTPTSVNGTITNERQLQKVGDETKFQLTNGSNVSISKTPKQDSPKEQDYKTNLPNGESIRLQEAKKDDNSLSVVFEIPKNLRKENESLIQDKKLKLAGTGVSVSVNKTNNPEKSKEQDYKTNLPNGELVSMSEIEQEIFNVEISKNNYDSVSNTDIVIPVEENKTKISERKINEQNETDLSFQLAGTGVQSSIFKEVIQDKKKNIDYKTILPNEKEEYIINLNNGKKELNLDVLDYQSKEIIAEQRRTQTAEETAFKANSNNSKRKEKELETDSSAGSFRLASDGLSGGSNSVSIHKSPTVDSKKNMDYTVQSTESDIDFSLKSIIGQKAVIKHRTLDQIEVDGRKGDTKRADILIKNLLPYIGSELASKAGQALGVLFNASNSIDNDNVTGVLSDQISNAERQVSSFLSVVNVDKYSALTADEMAESLLADFYSIQFSQSGSGLGGKGIAIKDVGTVNEFLDDPAAKFLKRYVGVKGYLEKVSKLSDTKMSQKNTEKLQANNGTMSNKGLSLRNHLTAKEKSIQDDLSSSNIIELDDSGLIKNVVEKLENTTAFRKNQDNSKKRIDRFGDRTGVGYILVVPFSENLDARVKIPFQNTPILGNESLSANYNNESLLHRSSELYNYTSSKREGYTLTTSYYALSPYGSNATGDMNENYFSNENNADLNSGLKGWSMDIIQDIYQAYKSLTLPTYPGATEGRNGSEKITQFRRPPFIKIIVGQIDEQKGYIKNMLYRNQAASTDVNGSERFLTSLNGVNGNPLNNTAWRTIKTFVVSNVSIDKKTAEYPYILDDNFKPLDTMGFDVTLSMLEVSPSYMDLEPDFEASIYAIESNSELVV